MIDTKDMRREIDRELDSMTTAERDRLWPMTERVRKCLDELETSRPFVPTESTPQSVMVSACAAAGYTEAETIDRLAAHAEALESSMRRCGRHVPGEVTPPPDDGREERLTRYRESLLRGYAGNRAEMIREWRMYTPDQIDFDTWLAGKAESLAHAMLAAERSPERG